MTLPRGATGLSAVCDCGISRSYSMYLSDFLKFHFNASDHISFVFWSMEAQYALLYANSIYSTIDQATSGELIVKSSQTGDNFRT